MISTWLILCIIIPGAFHQFSSLKHPTNYMTDYLDVSRDQKYAIFELSTDVHQSKLVESFPNLKNTKYAADTTVDRSIVSKCISALVNELNKKVASQIEKSSEDKNQFIKRYFLFNPVIYFQNKVNAFSKTDYYAYRDYRQHIQSIIDKKINFILEGTWNKVIIKKEKYIQYVEIFE